MLVPAHAPAPHGQETQDEGERTRPTKPNLWGAERGMVRRGDAGGELRFGEGG